MCIRDRLASPVLLTSRCVIFNWKDALQKDRIITALGVMVKAAANVELTHNDAEASARGEAPAARAPPRKFGHLHIVFRDWTFKTEGPDGEGPLGVYKQLFERERSGARERARASAPPFFSRYSGISLHSPSPGEHDAMVRNEVRHVLLEEAFESVHVWLFPPPTERTADLSLELRPSDVSRAFGEAVSGPVSYTHLTLPTIPLV